MDISNKNLQNYLATISEILEAEGNKLAKEILEVADSKIKETGYDNWNGGTTIWTIFLEVPPKKFTQIKPKKEEIESQINEALKSIVAQFEGENDWVNASIVPRVININTKINEKTKRELLKSLFKEDDPIDYDQDPENLISFLGEIIDLENEESTDSRFKDAAGDVWQHMVNNRDWELDYVFTQRFDFVGEDENFIKLIETVVSPRYRTNNDDIIKYVLLINSYLQKEELQLYADEYDEDTSLPVYKLRKLQKDRSFSDIPENKIPFFLCTKRSGHVEKQSSHTPPTKFPAFVLVASDWNDFGYYTSFYLYYYDLKQISHEIGFVHITDGSSEITQKVLESEFLALNSNFCSLGEKFDYYQKLKELLGDNGLKSTLYALKDASFFPEFSEKIEKNEAFQKSLIRGNKTERLWREARHRLYGFDMENLYNFSYSFVPKYSDDSVDLEFNFTTGSMLPCRIYSIIGKNGVGKTQFLSSLPLKISRKDDESFSPRAPMFSKIISVSYSAFDTFEIPKKTSSFNYIYCGLLNENKEPLTDRQRLLRFQISRKKIEELKRISEWREVLLNFIDEDLLKEFLYPNPEENIDYLFDETKFAETRKKLSSGQSLMLFIMTEIVANIRFDSLLLFDEVETHLHPNAITELINAIHNLTEKFESYCILTTHSPLVLQELPAKNIYVMERLGDIPLIRNISIESFGENLTKLTEEVFGNRDISKYYKKIIDKVAQSVGSYDEAVNLFQENNINLSLNALFYLKNKIK